MSRSVNSTPEKDSLLPTKLPPTSTTPLLNTVSSNNRDDMGGFILMLLSTLGFAGMALFVRAGESKFNFPPMSSVFIRGLILSLSTGFIMSITIGFRNAFRNVDTHIAKLLLIRSISGALGLIFMCQGLQRLPLGECQTIYFSHTIMVLLLSHFFLDEFCSVLDVIAAIVSLIGIVLVGQPFSGDHNAISMNTRIIGTIYSSLSAFFTAVSFVSIRRLSVNVHFLVNVFVFGIGSCIMCILYGETISIELIQSNSMGFFLILISAIFAIAAQCLLTKGLQHCNAVQGGLMRNLDVPLLYLLGLIFLNEVPNIIRLIGSALVLLSSLTIGAVRLLRVKNEEQSVFK